MGALALRREVHGPGGRAPDGTSGWRPATCWPAPAIDVRDIRTSIRIHVGKLADYWRNGGLPSTERSRISLRESDGRRPGTYHRRYYGSWKHALGRHPRSVSSTPREAPPGRPRPGNPWSNSTADRIAALDAALARIPDGYPQGTPILLSAGTPPAAPTDCSDTSVDRPAVRPEHSRGSRADQVSDSSAREIPEFAR